MRPKQTKAKQKPAAQLASSQTALQAQPASEVTPESEITQVQSLEIVQTLLLSSVGLPQARLTYRLTRRSDSFRLSAISGLTKLVVAEACSVR